MMCSTTFDPSSSRWGWCWRAAGSENLGRSCMPRGDWARRTERVITDRAGTAPTQLQRRAFRFQSLAKGCAVLQDTPWRRYTLVHFLGMPHSGGLRGTGCIFSKKLHLAHMGAHACAHSDLELNLLFDSHNLACMPKHDLWDAPAGVIPGEERSKMRTICQSHLCVVALGCPFSVTSPICQGHGIGWLPLLARNASRL